MATSRAALGLFAEKLFRARSFEDAFRTFEEQVFRLGYEGALYTFIPRVALDANLPQQPVYKVSESYGKEYLSHYGQARFDQHDPIVKAIADGVLTPLDWWFEVKKGTMTAPESRVIVTAREDYRIINGLTLPLMSDARGIAGASFTSSEPDRLYEQLKAQTLEELALCARMFHAAVNANADHTAEFLRPLLVWLTQKEKGVLRRLAEGKGLEQIADELGTTTRYVDRVVRHLREKLSGVGSEEQPRISRNQLAYYVGLLNLIGHLG